MKTDEIITSETFEKEDEGIIKRHVRIFFYNSQKEIVYSREFVVGDEVSE